MEPGQTPGQDHEPFDCHRPGFCRGCPGLEDAPFGRADTAHRDLVLADEAARGLIAPRAREMGGIPDPEGGDGVEGEAFAQIVGGIEMAVFDPCALFEGMEEAFDAPAQFVPPQHGGCRLQVRLPLFVGRDQQHPVQGAARLARLAADTGGRALLARRDGDHRERGIMAEVFGGPQGDRGAAHGQCGRPLRAFVRSPAGRDRDRAGAHGFGLEDMLPEVGGTPIRQGDPALDTAVGPHQQLLAGPVGMGEELPDVARAVTDIDYTGPRASPGQLLRACEPLHPAGNVLARGLAEVGLGHEEAEGPSDGIHGDPDMGQKAPGAPATAAEIIPIGRRRQPLIIECRGVLDRQHQRLRTAARPGKITGRLAPRLCIQAAPICMMRRRTRPSGCGLRPYSRSAQLSPPHSVPDQPRARRGSVHNVSCHPSVMRRGLLMGLQRFAMIRDLRLASDHHVRHGVSIRCPGRDVCRSGG